MPVGVKIVDDPTPGGDGMPVMDVPVFVGFAARGPCDRPVAIDSVASFEAVFGGLLDLVQGGRGEDPSERLTAHLYPAIAAFFAAGGRRCHVIRVAGAEASSARFTVSGLHLADLGGPMWTLQAQDFELRAASPGSWADRLELSARVRSQAVREGDPLLRGDLLRARRPSQPAQVAWKRVRADAALTVAWASTGWIRPNFAGPAIEPNSWLIERVQLDLAVRTPGQPLLRLDACGLAADAARLPWLALDADALWDAGLQASDWPLAGPVDAPIGDWALLPTGIGSDFDVWQPATLEAGDALERNGLASYQPALFLDPDWTPGLRGRLLMSWADEVRFFGERPRRLKGLHGSLGRDDACAAEASWVVVPDAVHPGWFKTAPLPPREVTVTTTPDPSAIAPRPPSTTARRRRPCRHARRASHSYPRLRCPQFFPQALRSRCVCGPTPSIRRAAAAAGATGQSA